MGLWPQDCLSPKALLWIQHENPNLSNFIISFFISLRVLEAVIRQIGSRRALRLLKAKSHPFGVTSLEGCLGGTCRRESSWQVAPGACLKAATAQQAQRLPSALSPTGGALAGPRGEPSFSLTAAEGLCAALPPGSHPRSRARVKSSAPRRPRLGPLASSPSLLLLRVTACLSLCCPLRWPHREEEPGETGQTLYPTPNCECRNSQAFRLF